MYLKLTLILIYTYFVKADEDIGQRYIDLLPEAEKQAFLDQVARRLHKEVKNKISLLNTSGEISNEELDEQGEFVKRIIEEESGSLRRQRNVERTDEADALTVQGLLRAQTEKSAYIDLTLRSDKRQRRNNNETEDSVGENSQPKADEIPVEIVYDKDGINDTVSNVVEKEISARRLSSGETSEGLDIQVRGIRRSAQDPDEFKTHTEIVDFDPDDETTEKATIQDNSNIDDTTTDTTTTMSAKTKSDDLDPNPLNFTASIYEDIDGVSNDTVSSEIDEKTETYSKIETFTTSKIITTAETKLEKETDSSTVTSTNPTLIPKNDKPNVTKNAVTKKHKNNLRSGSNENISSFLGNFVNNISELSATTETSTTYYVSDYTTESTNSFDETTMIIDGLSTTTETTKHLRSEDNILNESISSLQNNYENNSSELPTTTDGDDYTYNFKNYTTESTNTFNGTTVVLDGTSIQTTEDVFVATVNEKAVKRSSNINGHLDVVPNIQTTEDVFVATVNASPVDEKVVEWNNNVSVHSYNNDTKVHTNGRLRTDNDTLKVNNADELLVTTTEVQPITVHTGLASTAGLVVRVLNNFIKNESGTTDRNNESTTREKDSYNNLVKALRHGLKFQFEDESKIIGNEKVLPKLWLNEPNTIAKAREPYHVYEIPADEEPFVVKSKIQKHKKVTVRKKSKPRPSNNQEQPYYVPVYNYAPEHAYFNAYNRFGPNDDQNNEEFIDRNEPSDFDNLVESLYNNIGKPPKSVLRKFKFSKIKTEDVTKTTSQIATTKVKTKLKVPKVVKNPKFTEIYFNPDDYLDMDYYFGRMSKPYFSARKRVDLGNLPGGAVQNLPNSGEEYHVRDAINKGIVKNYMSGVRQLLYSHQIFGYVPQMTSTTTTEDPMYRAVATNTSEYLFYVPDKRNKEPKMADDISIDYYFGVNNRGEVEKQSVRLDNIIKSMNDINTIENESSNDNDISNILAKVKRHASQISRSKHNKRNKGTEKPYRGTIREILSIGDARDSFIHLEKMIEAKLPITRSRGSEGNEEIKPFLAVLKDMIGMDDQILEQYDWLGTTVDILSALEKLSVAIDTLLNRMELHPSDMQLLKYIEYLYITSRASIQHENNVGNTPEARLIKSSVESTENEIKIRNNKKSQSRKSMLLPRNKHKKKEYLKAKGLINRVWLYIRGRNDQNRSEIHNHKSLEELQEFLDDVRVSLFDLHNALKHIALVTKYNKQKWYRNLKELYLKELEKKQLLEVLLHLNAVRLFELVEESAKDNLEKSYAVYIETHQAHVERTKDELVFLMKVISEIKQLKE